MTKKKSRRKRSKENLLRRAMAQHAASGRAWERDYGDRPVINYATGEVITKTASEYLRKKETFEKGETVPRNDRFKRKLGKWDLFGDVLPEAARIIREYLKGEGEAAQGRHIATLMKRGRLWELSRHDVWAAWDALASQSHLDKALVPLGQWLAQMALAYVAAEIQSRDI